MNIVCCVLLSVIIVHTREPYETLKRLNVVHVFPVGSFLDQNSKVFKELTEKADVFFYFTLGLSYLFDFVCGSSVFSLLTMTTRT